MLGGVRGCPRALLTLLGPWRRMLVVPVQRSLRVCADYAGFAPSGAPAAPERISVVL